MPQRGQPSQQAQQAYAERKSSGYRWGGTVALTPVQVLEDSPDQVVLFHESVSPVTACRVVVVARIEPALRIWCAYWMPFPNTPLATFDMSGSGRSVGSGSAAGESGGSGSAAGEGEHNFNDDWLQQWRTRLTIDRGMKLDKDVAIAMFPEVGPTYGVRWND